MSLPQRIVGDSKDPRASDAKQPRWSGLVAESAPASPHASLASATPNQLLRLQQTVGNAGVVRMLARSAPRPSQAALARSVVDDVSSMSISGEYAQSLSDAELEEAIAALSESSAEHQSADDASQDNLRLLRHEKELRLAPQEAGVRTPGALAVRAAIEQATTPEAIAGIVTELRAAAASTPRDRTESVTVFAPGPTQIASYEAELLVPEAERAAGLVATTSRLPAGADPGMGNVSAVRAQLAQARLLANDPDSVLTEEQRAQIRAAVARAEADVASYQETASQGETRQAGMAPVLVTGGVLVGDDATGVGTVDDPLLILVGIAALAVIIATAPPAPQRDLDEAWRRIGDSLRELGEIGTGITMAIQGPRAAGQLTNIARHLARLLALAAVGGVASGEPPKNNNDDDPHWWTEIKASVRQFLQAIKGASRKQVIRELLKEGFTEAEIAEIEAALARAGETMGETIGNLLPPP